MSTSSGTLGNIVSTENTALNAIPVALAALNAIMTLIATLHQQSGQDPSITAANAATQFGENSTQIQAYLNSLPSPQVAEPTVPNPSTPAPATGS